MLYGEGKQWHSNREIVLNKTDNSKLDIDVNKMHGIGLLNVRN